MTHYSLNYIKQRDPDAFCVYQDKSLNPFTQKSNVTENNSTT